jgi:hypothetical protein
MGDDIDPLVTWKAGYAFHATNHARCAKRSKGKAEASRKQKKRKHEIEHASTAHRLVLVPKLSYYYYSATAPDANQDSDMACPIVSSRYLPKKYH